jgi:hypothetical protein
MVVFNDPVPVENPALQAVLMALEVRDAIGALTATWSRLGHEIGFGIGIAHGFATLGTIGFEGRFDYAAIGTVSNVASRLCDEAKPGQILISPRVLMKVEDAVKVEPVGEFALKGYGGLWRRTMWSPPHRKLRRDALCNTGATTRVSAANSRPTPRCPRWLVYYDSADLVQADIAKKFDGTGTAVVARADLGGQSPQSFIPDFANLSFPS